MRHAMHGRAEQMLATLKGLDVTRRDITGGMKALFLVPPPVVCDKPGAEAVNPERPINWERLYKETRDAAFSTHYKAVHIGDDHSNGIERLYDFVRDMWLKLRGKGGVR